MSKADGLSREVDGTIYGLYIEHLPGTKRPILAAYIDNKFRSDKKKVAEITNEDALREVMQGMFRNDWRRGNEGGKR